MSTPTVTVFTRPNCPYCVKAKTLLLSKPNLNVFQIVLDEQENYDQARAEMVRLAGGKTTVPQVFLGTTFLPGGFTGLKALDDSGELNKLLAEASSTDFPVQDTENGRWKIEKLANEIVIEDMDF